MPGMTGTDFLTKTREITPDAFRILLTGYADIDSVISSINKSGVFRFISKPWVSETLIETIREAHSLYSLKLENIQLNKMIAKQNRELISWNTQLEERVNDQTQLLSDKNVQLSAVNGQLLKNFNNSLEVFSSLMELRDPSITHHSKNVAALSYLMAKRLGLSHEQAINSKLAGLLHDIGKIGISDLVLNKDKSTYTKHELLDYQKHSVRGQMAIDSIDALRNIGELIRHHHESYNGTGFPDRLSGNAIPIESRIVALANYIDNNIGTLSPTKAVGTILDMVRAELGIMFDPELFQVAAETVKEYYSKIFPEQNIAEIEVEITMLRNGMVLARDLCTGTGILLGARGSILESHDITSIKRFAEIDPTGNNKVFIHRT